MAQVQGMPAEEYMGWASYHKVRQQAEELAMKRGRRG